MKEIDFILNKLRFITNSRTDKELCEILDINYSTLDTWKNNNKIPEKRLFKISQKLSINVNDLIKDSQSQNINENQNGNNAFHNSGKQIINKDTSLLDEDISLILKSIVPILENNKTKKEDFMQHLKKWLIENI